MFGENDPARRRAAIQEIFTEDAVFYDPNKNVYRGRAELDRIAGALRETHRDFQYQPLGEPEEVGNGRRIQWVEGRPGEAPDYGGQLVFNDVPMPTIAREERQNRATSGRGDDTDQTSRPAYPLQDAAQAWKDIARNLPRVDGMSPSEQGAARRKLHGKIVFRVA